MFKGLSQNSKDQHQIDHLIEMQYKRYKESQKGPLIGSGSKKTSKAAKENMVMNGSPEGVSFGRIKQMNKSEENYQALLRALDCDSCQSALLKIDRMKKADKFAQKSKCMMQKVFPNEQFSLNDCWKYIKEAVSEKTCRQNQEQ